MGQQDKARREEAELSPSYRKRVEHNILYNKYVQLKLTGVLESKQMPLYRR